MHSEQVSTVLLGHDISKEVISIDSNRGRAMKICPFSKTYHFILLFRVRKSVEILAVLFFADVRSIVVWHRLKFIWQEEQKTSRCWYTKKQKLSYYFSTDQNDVQLVDIYKRQATDKQMTNSIHPKGQIVWIEWQVYQLLTSNIEWRKYHPTMIFISSIN